MGIQGLGFGELPVSRFGSSVACFRVQGSGFGFKMESGFLDNPKHRNNQVYIYISIQIYIYIYMYI